MKSGFEVKSSVVLNMDNNVVFNDHYNNIVFHRATSNIRFSEQYRNVERSVGRWQPKGTKEKQLK